MDERALVAVLVTCTDLEELRRLLPDLPDRLQPACWRRIGQLAGAREELWAEVRVAADGRVGRGFLEGVGVEGATYALVVDALDSPHWLVVEEACFLAGELGDTRFVPRLVDLAGTHEEPLVQEAALGALGAIGDDRAIPVVRACLESRNVYLRRRAVVVAVAFDDPVIEEALARAREDRDPQVRAILADLDAEPEGGYQ